LISSSHFALVPNSAEAKPVALPPGGAIPRVYSAIAAGQLLDKTARERASPLGQRSGSAGA
jgi:hypothetical protein